MSYLDQTLTFESDKIYYNDSNLGIEQEVMMTWESSLMSASAAYVCTNGGDILEIGFGMGMSANYIQSHSISSHTIIENHPDIIPRAQAWASGKSNVTIVTSSWYDIRNSLSTYDGVFYDTFGDDDWDKFGVELPNLVKANAKVTWWNNWPEESNITYEPITVSPPANSYFNDTIYYLPKKSY